MSSPDNPFKIHIPELVANNPRESRKMLEETARITELSRAERAAEALRRVQAKPTVTINAPLYNPNVGRR